jgi:hypothetical protein
MAFVQHYPEWLDNRRKITRAEIVGELSAFHQMDAPYAPVRDDSGHTYLRWSVPGANFYFPLVYAPASAGIWIARTIGWSPAAMMYASRNANVIFLLAGTIVALRLAPEFRALIAAVALMPMTLHEAAASQGERHHTCPMRRSPGRSSLLPKSQGCSADPTSENVSHEPSTTASPKFDGA